MALTLPTPFFRIEWMPATNSGLLPASSGQPPPPFMSVQWRAREGTAYYPFVQNEEVVNGLPIPPKTASPKD
ncbi:hypothetical protein ACQKEN_23515 [Pseudomonas sp. NPDC078416]|jgi:hypothetical protein|uniref:hypothetical protein n=1 Tax=Pseudomonas sp. NPDC078416 TaxID=3390637 RepID=UPI003D01AB58